MIERRKVNGLLPMVCVRKILNYLHPCQIAHIDKYQSRISTAIIRKAAVRIQRWYKRYRLLGTAPYHYVTLRTLKRFYVAKYKNEWLTDLPVRLIRKLHLHGSGIDRYMHYTYEARPYHVRAFYRFCDQACITVDDLNFYGW